MQRACSFWRLPLLSYNSRGVRGLCEDASLFTVSCPRLGESSGARGLHIKMLGYCAGWREPADSPFHQGNGDTESQERGERLELSRPCKGFDGVYARLRVAESHRGDFLLGFDLSGSELFMLIWMQPLLEFRFNGSLLCSLAPVFQREKSDSRVFDPKMEQGARL